MKGTCFLFTSGRLHRLVQNFLRFPCAFSQSDVGTRCPVLYRLRYNASLTNNDILIKHPVGVEKPEDLSDHLRKVMERIERAEGFSLDEYRVHLERNHYRDFEILDASGLISGCRAYHRTLRPRSEISRRSTERNDADRSE